jgi:hypothetical protein
VQGGSGEGNSATESVPITGGQDYACTSFSDKRNTIYVKSMYDFKF